MTAHQYSELVTLKRTKMIWKDFLNNPVIPWILFVASLIVGSSIATTLEMRYNACCVQEMHWEQTQADTTFHPKAGEEVPTINEHD